MGILLRVEVEVDDLFTLATRSRASWWDSLRLMANSAFRMLMPAASEKEDESAAAEVMEDTEVGSGTNGGESCTGADMG